MEREISAIMQPPAIAAHHDKWMMPATQVARIAVKARSPWARVRMSWLRIIDAHRGSIQQVVPEIARKRAASCEKAAASISGF